MSDRIPHDDVAEMALLGAILIDPVALDSLPHLRGEDFYVQHNGWVYDAILHLHEQRRDVDLVTLSDVLERRGLLDEVGGITYLNTLIQAVPSAVHANSYAHIVRERRSAGRCSTRPAASPNWPTTRSGS